MARSGRLQPPFFHCASFPLRSAFFHAKEEIMKRKSVFLCSVQRWRSARRLALGHRAAALAVEQAERAGVLQVQVPVEIQW
jgi:hypothetical protein